MAGNVSIETDAADNWKPSKKKSRERIDGIVALIMGLDRASRQEAFTSVYDKRGPLFLTMSDEWVNAGR
jgi:phage terminase large subunit-like protein